MILASTSPRRIQMLKENGFSPVIIPPEVDETIPEHTKPHIAVMFLALKKALCAEAIAIEKGYGGDEILIAADTIVVFKGRIIGKPADKKEAIDILQELRGEKHTVFTGVAVLKPGTGYRKVFYEASDVFFTDYSDEVVESYANSTEPFDKAGGYAVQGTWGKYIERVDGDVNNVIGLPLARLLKELPSNHKD